LQLGHAIAGRGRCLIILDNFEQVVEHARASLGRWLDRAAEASFIVTSRARLHLPGEGVMTLDPLPMQGDAPELFVLRARGSRPTSRLATTTARRSPRSCASSTACRSAIELAAARTRVLSPRQLVERLSDRFSVLAGARGATARQATLRAAIEPDFDRAAEFVWKQRLAVAGATLRPYKIHLGFGGAALIAAFAALTMRRRPPEANEM
jgi:predicted ATPase